MNKKILNFQIVHLTHKIFFLTKTISGFKVVRLLYILPYACKSKLIKLMNCCQKYHKNAKKRFDEETATMKGKNRRVV